MLAVTQREKPDNKDDGLTYDEIYYSVIQGEVTEAYSNENHTYNNSWAVVYGREKLAWQSHPADHITQSKTAVIG